VHDPPETQLEPATALAPGADWMTAMLRMVEDLLATQSELVEIVEGLCVEVEDLKRARGEPEGLDDGRAALIAQAAQARHHAAELRHRAIHLQDGS